MRPSQVTALILYATTACAFPGMKGGSGANFHKRLAQVAGSVDGDAPPELIGDLKTGATTPIGKTIASILTGDESAQSNAAGYWPPIIGTSQCRQDTCCIWSYVSMALTPLFLGPTGRCNAAARQAVRLGFHDAAGWSKALAANGQDFGGADGSIALSNEMSRAENNGLQPIVQKLQTIQKLFNVGMADLIQFAAIHAVVTCPLGPRIRFFAGRKDSSKPAPNGLLPDVNASADSLIALFQDKTITPHQLAALLGAHTTSEQFFVDPKRAGAPQDSTPGVWDVRFYNQTLQPASQVSPKLLRFQSDLVLSTDSRVNDEWVKFAGAGGQDHWDEDYANSYVRVSLLGVNNINSLTECTKVLPPARPSFPGKDIEFLNQ